MLWTLFVILFIMWLLGMVTSYTLGGFIHILLVLALVAVLIQLIAGTTPSAATAAATRAILSGDTITCPWP